MGRLDGRVAIITGAGQGIGLAYAERFLAEGAKVVVAEVDAKRAESAMAQLKGKGDALLVETDISGPRLVCRVRQGGRRHVRRHPRADQQRRDLPRHRQRGRQLRLPAQDHEREPARRVAHGRAVAPTMVQQRLGRIINQSSGAAYSYMFPPMEEFGGLGNFSYSITKWGVVGLTKFMAAQLGQYNITVNCIAPGVTMTEATKKVVPGDVHRGDDVDDGDEVQARA